MPKLFVRSTAGTFSHDARASVAAELTELGIACEELADRQEVREGVWVVFDEWSPETVFSAGRAATRQTIVLEVFALEGGLDAYARQRLIAEATSVLDEHAEAAEYRTPTFVVIHDIPGSRWGMYGEQVELAALREPA
ncbi:tautomerase family protein [Amnibacterium setariae]|uniref:4-oxalocrotonate tautomerase-like domain-containing protein n=1 Tax=Amnibacterium setariae TaxID=2306585 RepID=A0A3A1TZ07_9MICO|nr:tautomerase family protein [Amnibacterium setariae]RIX29945.1 hypothetical protein D1781_00220 [Amnibacterium setariae]